jgi:NADH-quinone oxidoreductase subunit M
MPVFAAFVLIVVFASIGLPGTNGFIGELLILLGVFKATTAAAVLAATGIVLGAVYMLRMYQRVLLGPVGHPANEALKDLNPREVLTLVPIILLIVWIGIYPRPFLKLTAAGTTHLVEMIQMKQSQSMHAKPVAIHALQNATTGARSVPPGERR